MIILTASNCITKQKPNIKIRFLNVLVQIVFFCSVFSLFFSWNGEESGCFHSMSTLVLLFIAKVSFFLFINNYMISSN